MTIAENLQLINSRITRYEQQYQRASHSVRLLAVSKGQPIHKIQEAIQHGQRAFGENYLQEALEKIHLLESEPIEWHFIGKIQRNKTKKIAEHFDWVESIEDMQIATRLNNQRPAHLPPLNVCIEVNISEEATKSGVRAESVPALLEGILSLPALRLRGLMASPATHQRDPQLTPRDEFHRLYLLWESLRHRYPMLDTLSMGMSDDFEAAIAEGSTLVRIGTALFGKR